MVLFPWTLKTLSDASNTLWMFLREKIIGFLTSEGNVTACECETISYFVFYASYISVVFHCVTHLLKNAK